MFSVHHFWSLIVSHYQVLINIRKEEHLIQHTIITPVVALAFFLP
jgi:hypothetical protein